MYAEIFETYGYFVYADSSVESLSIQAEVDIGFAFPFPRDIQNVKLSTHIPHTFSVDSWAHYIILSLPEPAYIGILS